MVSSFSLKEILQNRFKGTNSIVIYSYDYRIKRFCKELEEKFGFKVKQIKDFLILEKSLLKKDKELKRKINRYGFKYIEI